MRSLGPRQREGRRAAPGDPSAWWADDRGALLESFGTSVEGLSAAKAAARREPRDKYGRKFPGLRLFVDQFTSPLVLILIVAAVLSFALREWLDATIILV